MSIQITQTRALDGTQTAVWEEYEASWTYHPDNGVNMNVRSLNEGTRFVAEVSN